ncbi:SDR family oxidoreductase [Pimelobacter simplex]|uniref:SDR family oxidoreductase n=1 Tax=Nocardioides simplex TaxID=2045 RepID=A0A7J5E0C4_NOCSI|nr:SDR family oxidoreductase [Pimelobacter simplex]KAB2811354.1 SDR family oxidoreductase [Pimelobacter simplex]
MSQPQQRAQRSVVVTGAAAGIGRAVATRFHAAGYLVGAYDVDAAGLATLAGELDGIVTGELDVRDATAWEQRLAELTERTGGTLDVLVNNAGILRSGPFVSIPLADQQRIVDVNVKGVLNGCHLAYPYLRATRGAHVVNLASASAIYGQPELATYSATKFAVRGLTEALDLEWAADDITVRAVWPLFVQTAMTTGMDIASTRSLGIRLTADDVAREVLDVVRPHRLPQPVHRAVGTQAKVLMASSGLAPAWVLRRINGRIAGGHR